jgi:serine/threonine protein kinase/tetratricopeptide (TPR) repeat protein
MVKPTKEHAMSVAPPSAKEIFLAAIEKPTPAERAAFLDQVCAGDAALRQRVEALLQAHDEPGSFLNKPPAAEPGDTGDVAPGRWLKPDDLAAVPKEGPGTRIGPYKLLQPIGEGGMGAVFVAEQEHPVKRRVALKIIKPGMDSAQVVARFEAERQALALMDHTHIAKVLDAGTTASGRPFFVMELVKGLPITRYCDELHLSLRERLELFVPVCQAIQHAHQKGVIHRDIKPSNVLVCMQDGKPVAKVIDFGVAKATAQKLTERTLMTEFGAVVGTLEYMSPEQAELNVLDIDTRADVYCLGVLLYELLTGSTPLDRKRLRQAAFTEMLRIIKEEEPPKPSTRLTQSKESLASLAAQRRTEPARLMREVRGELDWIVMKALEKDRTRRYETANGLAHDVQRYLHDEPVEACLPSAGYRLRKLVRRHRGPALAGALVLLAMLTGIIGTTWGLIRAQQARQAEAAQRALAEANEQKAREEKRIAEAVRTFLQQDLLRQANPAEQADAVRRAGGVFETTENPTIKELLDRAAVELMPGKIEVKFPQQPEVQASILQTVGATYWAIGEAAKAVEFLTRSSDTYRHIFGADHPTTLAILDKLAEAYLFAGKTAEAVVLLKEVRDARVKRLGADHADTLTTLDHLAWAYHCAGNTTEAVTLLEQVREARVKKLGADHPDTLATLDNLARVYHAIGKTAEAVTLHEQVYDARVKSFGADHPLTLLTLLGLAGAYLSTGKTVEAVAFLEQARDAGTKKLGADHPITLATLHNLAQTYRAAGKTAEAVALYEQVRDACAKKLGADHPLTLATLDSLAGAYLLAGKTAEAIALYEQVRDARVKTLGTDHPHTLTTLAGLAGAYQAAGKPEQALPLFLQAAVGIEKRQFVHPQAGPIVGALSDCYERLNQSPQAEVWRRKWLAVVKERSGPESLSYAGELASWGLRLLQQKRWIDAEPVLRECLALREKKEPDAWTTFNARSMLGEALNGQQRRAEAEPLLLQGYEGLRQRAAKIPKEGKPRLAEALERLVQLYDATGPKDKADEWRKQLEAAKRPMTEPKP